MQSSQKVFKLIQGFDAEPGLSEISDIETLISNLNLNERQVSVAREFLSVAGALGFDVFVRVGKKVLAFYPPANDYDYGERFPIAITDPREFFKEMVLLKDECEKIGKPPQPSDIPIYQFDHEDTQILNFDPYRLIVRSLAQASFGDLVNQTTILRLIRRNLEHTRWAFDHVGLYPEMLGAVDLSRFGNYGASEISVWAGIKFCAEGYESPTSLNFHLIPTKPNAYSIIENLRIIAEGIDRLIAFDEGSIPPPLQSVLRGRQGLLRLADFYTPPIFGMFDYWSLPRVYVGFTNDEKEIWLYGVQDFPAFRSDLRDGSIKYLLRHLESNDLLGALSSWRRWELRTLEDLCKTRLSEPAPLGEEILRLLHSVFDEGEEVEVGSYLNLNREHFPNLNAFVNLRRQQIDSGLEELPGLYLGNPALLEVLEVLCRVLDIERIYADTQELMRLLQSLAIFRERGLNSALYKSDEGLPKVTKEERAYKEYLATNKPANNKGVNEGGIVQSVYNPQSLRHVPRPAFAALTLSIGAFWVSGVRKINIAAHKPARWYGHVVEYNRGYGIRPPEDIEEAVTDVFLRLLLRLSEQINGVDIWCDDDIAGYQLVLSKEPSSDNPFIQSLLDVGKNTTILSASQFQTRS